MKTPFPNGPGLDSSGAKETRLDAAAGSGIPSPNVGAGILPRPESAKVKMGLAQMSPPDMLTFIQNHVVSITGNPLYPLPSPEPEVFREIFEAYRSSVLAVEAAETAYQNALAVRKARLQAMVSAMNRRAAYVQSASNGNRQAIVSCGLSVKSDPTKTTSIPPPEGLRVELNEEAGSVKIRWTRVKGAKNYLLQVSPDVTPRVWEQLSCTGWTHVTTNLPVGQSYAFRVAACGVPGQSSWSPEVVRGVA